MNIDASKNKLAVKTFQNKKNDLYLQHFFVPYKGIHLVLECKAICKISSWIYQIVTFSISLSSLFSV